MKHVYNDVKYLYFSDKCLNQYKMNIFCKETQAHLQLHGGLAAAAGSDGNTGLGSGSLITPDLWLRDCRGESEEETGGGSGAAGAGSTSPRSSLSSGGGDERSPVVSPSPPHKLTLQPSPAQTNKSSNKLQVIQVYMCILIMLNCNFKKAKKK
jgi:hypothetical protein